jgi:hypothetical protein
VLLLVRGTGRVGRPEPLSSTAEVVGQDVDVRVADGRCGVPKGRAGGKEECGRVPLGGNDVHGIGRAERDGRMSLALHVPLALNDRSHGLRIAPYIGTPTTPRRIPLRPRTGRMTAFHPALGLAEWRGPRRRTAAPQPMSIDVLRGNRRDRITDGQEAPFPCEVGICLHPGAEETCTGRGLQRLLPHEG